MLLLFRTRRVLMLGQWVEWHFCSFEYRSSESVIFSMDTDTNVYGCLLTAIKVGCIFLNITFYWCNLLIPVLSMIIVSWVSLTSVIFLFQRERLTWRVSPQFRCWHVHACLLALLTILPVLGFNTKQRRDFERQPCKHAAPPVGYKRAQFAWNSRSRGSNSFQILFYDGLIYFPC